MAKRESLVTVEGPMEFSRVGWAPSGSSRDRRTWATRLTLEWPSGYCDIGDVLLSNITRQVILEQATTSAVFLASLDQYHTARVFQSSFSMMESQRTNGSRMNKDSTTIVVTAIVCATFLVIAIFIWPTPYTYEIVTRPFYNRTKQEVYRINRFTGHSETVIKPTPKTIE